MMDRTWSALLATLYASTTVWAADAAQPAAGWTTLGTAGGPVANASRSQPANLLDVDGQHWLVDCGDGTRRWHPMPDTCAASLPPRRGSAQLFSH